MRRTYAHYTMKIENVYPPICTILKFVGIVSGGLGVRAHPIPPDLCQEARIARQVFDFLKQLL
jgi:hypothetical protein